MLRMENVSKTFGGVAALSHVDLDVHEGDVLGIIGPNGSGKTTTVNAITGFIRPSGGRIYFKGKEITGKNLTRLQTWELPGHSRSCVPTTACRLTKTW